MGRKAALLLATVLLIAGCATGRNLKDTEDMNAKIDNLQNQLQMKNKEIGMLNDELRNLKGQVDSAQRARKNAETRLDEAMGKLSGKRSAASGYDKAGGDYVK